MPFCCHACEQGHKEEHYAKQTTGGCFQHFPTHPHTPTHTIATQWLFLKGIHAEEKATLHIPFHSFHLNHLSRAWARADLTIRKGNRTIPQGHTHTHTHTHRAKTWCSAVHARSFLTAACLYTHEDNISKHLQAHTHKQTMRLTHSHSTCVHKVYLCALMNSSTEQPNSLKKQLHSSLEHSQKWSSPSNWLHRPTGVLQYKHTLFLILLKHKWLSFVCTQSSRITRV